MKIYLAVESVDVLKERGGGRGACEGNETDGVSDNIYQKHTCMRIDGWLVWGEKPRPGSSSIVDEGA